MNGIAFAGAAENSAVRSDKNFSVLIASGKCVLKHPWGKTEFSAGEVAVVPPLVKYSLTGTARLIVLEQALLPFKEVRVIGDDAGRGIAHAAGQAETYYAAKNSTREGVLAALGGLIAAYLAAFAGDGRTSPVVLSVCGEIKKNLSEPSFSLEDSIRLLPLNYDYVRKLFKREMGVTPHEYLIRSRMELARELISSGMGNKYSRYSVGQIAEACGFAEPLYFSRVFKKYFGISPSEAGKNWTGN